MDTRCATKSLIVLHVLFKLVHFIKGLIQTHFTTLCSTHLNVIQYDTAPGHRQLTLHGPNHRRHYAFAVTVLLLGSVYSFIGLHLDAGLSLDLKHLAHSTKTFTHQVYPQVIWLQIDASFAFGCFVVAAMSLAFILVPPLDSRYGLVGVQGSKLLQMHKHRKLR